MPAFASRATPVLCAAAQLRRRRDDFWRKSLNLVPFAAHLAVTGESRMLEHLPQEIRDVLTQPKRRERRRIARLNLHVGDSKFPIRRMWDDGFAIEATRPPRLRGAVEIREGRRRIWTCLIVAVEVTDGELRCTFKRLSPAQDSAPADYWRGGEPLAT
jgi:hypothetical protein